VRSLHITELRSAIDSLRSHLGLSAYSWQTNASVGAPIKADPIVEMRTALDQALGAPSGGYTPGLMQGQPVKAVHIQELRNRVLAAWQSGTGLDLRWLVADQLGTPRVVIDKTGSLAGVRRHDYFPFGEEVAADGSWRNTAHGYGADDKIRQKFTGHERDDETKLDYARARYYASQMGRFASTDPLTVSGRLADPQTWDRYAYALNNPLRFTDPSGMAEGDQQQQQQQQPAPQATPAPPPPTQPPPVDAAHERHPPARSVRPSRMREDARAAACRVVRRGRDLDAGLRRGDDEGRRVRPGRRVHDRRRRRAGAERQLRQLLETLRHGGGWSAGSGGGDRRWKNPNCERVHEPGFILGAQRRRWWDVDWHKEHNLSVFISDPRPGASPSNVWWTGDAGQVAWTIYGFESLWLPATLLENDSRERLASALFAGSRQQRVSLHFNKGLAGAPREAIEAARDTAPPLKGL
jgi:RHS repeat-associated protein